MRIFPERSTDEFILTIMATALIILLIAPVIVSVIVVLLIIQAIGNVISNVIAQIRKNRQKGVTTPTLWWCPQTITDIKERNNKFRELKK